MVIRGLKRRLLDNSIDAFILSLETINRVSVNHRIEAFSMLLCNAWELLLKAQVITKKGRRAIYYPKERGQPRRTLSAKDALKVCIPDENDPVRKNLEAVIDLRDESVHLIISNLPSDILELLQSCTFNYHHCLSQWFGISLSDHAPLGMMSFVYEISPLQKDLSILRNELGAEEIDFLTQFQGRIHEEARELGSPKEFIASVEYKVVLVNRENQADISLGKGTDGAEARIFEKPRDPGRTHPLRMKEVVEAVKSRTKLERSFNNHCFQSVRLVLGIENRSDWFYQGEVPGSPKQYSHALVDEIVDRIECNSDWVEWCRDRYRDHQRGMLQRESTNGQ